MYNSRDRRIRVCAWHGGDVTLCSPNVGPPSATPAQQWKSIGSSSWWGGGWRSRSAHGVTSPWSTSRVLMSPERLAHLTPEDALISPPESLRQITANTSRWPNVGLMSGQRRRRWANIKPILGQRLVLAGIPHYLITRRVIKWFIKGVVHCVRTAGHICPDFSS